MLDFRPPKRHQIGYRLSRWFLPVYMRSALKGLTFEVDDSSLARLREAVRRRCVLLPNHTNHDDPYVMFALSLRVRQPFYYLAARESFTEMGGGAWRGFVMQQMGSYSVVRGAPDRASFKMTRSLIAGGERPVVIFGEGELSHCPGRTLPFESGVGTLAFWGLEDALERDPNAEVLLVPIGIRYIIDPDSEPALEDGLNALEDDLFRRRGTGDPLDRFREIGRHLLSTLETAYAGRADVDRPLSARLDALRSAIFAQMERFFGIEPKPDAGILDRARVLRNRVDDETHREFDPSSGYARRLQERRAATFRTFADAIHRVKAFHALDLLAIERDPSREALFELLWLIEEELFGKARSRVPRVGHVRVGEPFRLNDALGEYGASRRAAVEHVTRELERRVQSLLDGFVSSSA